MGGCWLAHGRHARAGEPNASSMGWRVTHRVGRVSLSLVLCAIFLGASPGSGLAAYCQLYAPNDGGAKVYNGTSVASGTSATIDLETAAVSAGQIVAHPLQIASNSSDDFVGWGTYRGAATNGHGSSDCPANFGAGWHTYVDGSAFGVYFCQGGFGDLSSNASAQVFKFYRGQCSGLSKWVFFLNGVNEVCKSIDGSSGTNTAGSETVPHGTVLNATVRYYALKVKFAAGWADWGSNSSVCITDPPYYINTLSATDFRVLDR